MKKSILPKGFGKKNLSQELNCQYDLGFEFNTTILAPLFLAMAITPSATVCIGPLGPSGVIAISTPDFISLIVLINDLVAPLDEDPLI